MELVVMAAGMGSRFGGLKQIEPVDASGDFIIDYSIYDAIRCGFDKVIFVIKKENEEVFKQTIGSRIEKNIKTEYVFQTQDGIVDANGNPVNRQKPFGTGHAVLSAKPKVESNFAVINADDFYGYDAFKTLAEFLKNNTDENCYAIVGYEAINTTGNSGSVKRGVCFENNDYLEKITESSLTLQDDGSLLAVAIDGSNPEPHTISSHTTVSMNMFGFTKSFMSHLENGFDEFLKANQNNLESCEYFLPTVVDGLIKKNIVKTKVLKTTSMWYGITYKQDKEEVVNALNNLVKNGEYPEHLWEN